MPIFRFIGHNLTIGDKILHIYIYKQTSSTVYTQNDVSPK